MNWDVGGQVGVVQRFTTGGAAGAGSPTPGPGGELYAHLALFPMVRAGPYVAHDISPRSGASARQITEGGLTVKVTPPLLPAPWRSWLTVGVGYARTYAPSYDARVEGTGVAVRGMGGGLLDVPVGLGLGYRLDRAWELTLELGGRFGLAFAGSMYDAQGCGCSAPFPGKDSVALSVSLGLSLNR